MERLTRRITEATIELSAKANQFQYNGSPQRVQPKHPFWNVFDRLCNYEDAEEQGLLLRLPCKVGDTAWYVHRNGIDEVVIDSFIVNVNIFANVSYYIGCERFGKTLTPYKTLFFTREEAEAALAEKGGAE